MWLIKRLTWVTELVLVAIQLLCCAGHVEDLVQLRFRADPQNVQLVTGQGYGYAEGLLEGCIAHGGQGHNLVVLTRGVQVRHRPAEH